jgi:hypothetical protein
MNNLSVPKPDSVEDITSYAIPKVLTNASIVVQFKSRGPVKAEDFASLIDNTVNLLQSLAKDGDPPIMWSITEAAIIGEHAGFTLTAYDPADIEAHLAKLRPEQVEVIQ